MILLKDAAVDLLPACGIRNTRGENREAYLKQIKRVLDGDLDTIYGRMYLYG